MLRQRVLSLREEGAVHRSPIKEGEVPPTPSLGQESYYTADNLEIVWFRHFAAREHMVDKAVVGLVVIGLFQKFYEPD